MSTWRSFFAVLLLALASCTSLGPSSEAPPSIERARALDQSGDYAEAAKVYEALAAQNDDADLKARFTAVAKELAENEDKIIGELNVAQGKPVQIKGYYHPDMALVSAAMRPSATFNKAIATLLASR